MQNFSHAAHSTLPAACVSWPLEVQSSGGARRLQLSARGLLWSVPRALQRCLTQCAQWRTHKWDATRAAILRVLFAVVVCSAARGYICDFPLRAKRRGTCHSTCSAFALLVILHCAALCRRDVGKRPWPRDTRAYLVKCADAQQYSGWQLALRAR